jgi:REP element-mobilizing transposase RayT
LGAAGRRRRFLNPLEFDQERLFPGFGLKTAIREQGWQAGKGYLAAPLLEHSIRDDADLERHVDYIHFNPIKHGYVARVADWPHSSFHR